jgi:ATP-binding cassette, subfamily B, bacterial
MQASDPKKNESLSSLIGWSLNYAKRSPGALGAVIATLLLKTGLDVLKPWPMVFLVDYVLQGKSRPLFEQFVNALPGPQTATTLIAWSVGATIVIFLLSWTLGVANAYANISLGQRMVYSLAGDLFAKLQQLSLRFHASKLVGDNIRRVTADCAAISVIVKDALLPVASSAVSLVVMFTIMWQIDAGLTLLALAVVPIMIFAFHRYAEPMMALSYQQQEIESRIYSTVEQTFSAMPAVQAFCREDFNDIQFRGITRETTAATLAATKVQVQFKILIGLSTAVGTAGILWIGARHALNGGITVGTILLFLSYLTSLYAPLEAIMYTTSTIQGASGGVRRVREVLETERDVADKPNAIPLAKVRGRVQFANVTFGYEPHRPVLKEVSLEVEPGETIALVGPTGAGKTTLLGLIPRFFDPWQGQVLIDGHDLRDLQLNSLRRQVGMVLQEAFLFPMTIAENIAYARPDAPPAEIEAAARAANAHEFIQRLPQGYNAVLGERGATLSGGERQRLSIARALLKDAPILILDEPTSALDVETEKALLDALERLTKDRTTFIIAHRLSTIRRADRIVVLNEGKIVEVGTHEALLARGNLYARFHAMQFGQDTKAIAT